MTDASGVLGFRACACAYRSDAWRCDDHSRFSRIDITNRNHVDLTLRFGFRRGSRAAHRKPLTMHQRLRGLSRVRRRAERRATRCD